MKKRKTPKNRPYRSTLDNALWSFREILKQAPVCFLLMALEVPLNVCLSFTTSLPLWWQSSREGPPCPVWHSA